MLEKLLSVPNTYTEAGCYHATCCMTCLNLVSCSSSCPKCADRKKELQSERKADKQAQKKAQEASAAPKLQLLRDVWARWGEARQLAGLSIDETMRAIGRPYYGDPADMEKKELGEARFNPDDYLPFKCGFGYAEAKALLDSAEVLHCSVDYLLCRTDVPKLDTRKAPAPEWVPLEWLPGQERPPRFGQKAVAKFKVEGLKKPTMQLVYWDGVCWAFRNGAGIDGECVGWFPLPEDDA